MKELVNVFLMRQDGTTFKGIVDVKDVSVSLGTFRIKGQLSVKLIHVYRINIRPVKP